jgi:hypothetical protein
MRNLESLLAGPLAKCIFIATFVVNVILVVQSPTVSLVSGSVLAGLGLVVSVAGERRSRRAFRTQQRPIAYNYSRMPEGRQYFALQQPPSGPPRGFSI